MIPEIFREERGVQATAGEEGRIGLEPLASELQQPPAGMESEDTDMGMIPSREVSSDVSGAESLSSTPRHTLPGAAGGSIVSGRLKRKKCNTVTLAAKRSTHEML